MVLDYIVSVSFSFEELDFYANHAN